MESLERLQGLYADLVAFSETRLVQIDRLWQELEESLQEFRVLLGKVQPTPAERESFKNRKIVVHSQEFGINDEFSHLSAAVGNVLDISEVEAGRWLIETQVSGENEDEQAIIADVVQKFHDRRDLLLQSLRIILEQSQNLEHDPILKARFEDIVGLILDIKTGPPSNGSAFAQRCLKFMEEIEAWQVKVNEQIQSKAILSQVRGKEFYTTFEFQRGSLFKQHEALGAILAFLFRGNYTISEDLRKLHNVTKKWQRLDYQYTHYLPGFSAAFRQYGAPEGSTTLEAAKPLHLALTSAGPDSNPSSLRPFVAVLDMWWTAEYSGFSRDAVQDKEAVREADARAKIVKRALDDGGLELMLSICAHTHPEVWRLPARHELITILLDGTGVTWEGMEQSSSYFTNMLMDCYESFAEAWITNMPDSIRNLKSEEDDQRLSQLTALQDGLMPTAQRQPGARMHLESFLVLIAFAVQQRPEAAEQFWADPDGNLYGFVQWASRRQTVPRASAFCEMLCGLSETPDTAEFAHKFLMDDSIAVQNARGRRMPTMSYQQIFAELEFYARKVHERSSAPTQVPKSRAQNEPELNETESPIMLSCYLRLLGHLCRHTSLTRFYILGMSGMDLPKSLLTLSSGPIPSFLRASIFSTIEALLTDKDSATADRIWQIVDDWASTAHDRALGTTQQAPSPTLAALQGSLAAVNTSHDQSDAFVKLLRTLIWPLPEASAQPLPFPPELGSHYRAPGIVPYVDFVCAQIVPKRVQELFEETGGAAVLRCYHCLDFIGAGLHGFNEHFVTKLEQSATQLRSEAEYATTYGQRHPFARIMQWLFSVDLNKALMLLLQQPADDLTSILPDSPILNTLQRTIDIVIGMLELQPTYFDIVQPKVKVTDTQRAIQYTGFTAIEESIVANPSVVLNLCQYSSTQHIQLALKSLGLLQKLASSPKLQHYGTNETRSLGKARRLIDMLGTTGELEMAPIAQSLAISFTINERELESGFESDGYLMKDGSLAFFNACLSALPGRPNIVHLLLGFRRIGERLAISPEIDDGTSLLSATVRLACEYPDAQDGSLLSWLIHLKSAAISVMRILWTSPLSSALTLAQLQRTRFFQAEFASQFVVSQSTSWDGLSILDADFWRTTSAEGFAEFLSYRSCLYDYIAKELRNVAAHRLQSFQQQYLSTLQGKSTEIDGSIITHPSIFDLFDFAELDTDVAFVMAELQYFHEIDFEAYTVEPTDDLPELYDIGGINVVLNRMFLNICREAIQSGRQVDEEEITLELDYVLGLLDSRNRYSVAQKARIKTLRNYVDMVISAIDCCPLEPGPKAQFTLRILQLILPKMDVYMVDGAPESMELSRAADALLAGLANSYQAPNRTKLQNTIADKLFQLFRISAEGIPRSTTGPDLRSLLYSICSEYLSRILDTNATDSESYRKARGNSMDCIRSVGTPMISTLSDDAEDGLDNCRLNALNLLAQLVSVARSENSAFVIETLVKANVLEVLLEPVKEVAAEFQATDPINRPYLISIFESRMMLCLQLSRTRVGAIALLDAGLIQALRDSMIFRADPDLGMDLDSLPPTVTLNGRSDTSALTRQPSDAATSALHNYFLLLSASLRVLLSTFSSIGPQNEKIIFLIRNFLADNRANMVGIFKKAVGVNGKINNPQSRRVLEECVRCYTGLAVGCGFIDFEDTTFVEGMNDSFGAAYGNGANAGGIGSSSGRAFT